MRHISRTDWKYLNLLGWCAVAGLFAIVLQNALQRDHERDFVYFYSCGRILNHYPPAQLYDYELQKRTFTEIQPLHEGVYGPSPYPPFVAMLFRPFARLPFLTAYWSWMGITLILYLAGLTLLARRFLSGDRLKQSALFCFALCFWPFAARTLLNGQLSAIGFFCLTLAICLEHSGSRFLSGLALSLCAYKPTLLLLLLPMLFVIRRYRTLLGFAAGVAALVSLTTVVEGFAVWPAWLRLTRNIAGFRPFLALDDYIDASSFAALLAPGAAPVRFAVLCLSVIAGLWLLREWWLFRPIARSHSAVVPWAATLTWTLVLNVYVPMYDSILVLISLVVIASSSSPVARGTAFRAAAMLLLLIAPVTRAFAVGTGVQLLTLVLVSIGVLQLAVLRRSVMAGGSEKSWIR